MAEDKGKIKEKGKVSSIPMTLGAYAIQFKTLEKKVNDLQLALDATESMLQKSLAEREKLAIYGELENLISEYDEIDKSSEYCFEDAPGGGIVLKVDLEKNTITFQENRYLDDRKTLTDKTIVVKNAMLHLEMLAHFLVSQIEPYKHLNELERKLSEKREFIQDLYRIVVERKVGKDD